RAALLFHWKSLRRQVRVEGKVEQTTADQADAYFATRSRGSQLGAWASQQSRPMESKAELVARVAQTTAKYNVQTIPRPDHWSGFRVIPERWEFWQDGEFRLHDRFQYDWRDNAWYITRLYP
ncbi:MAG: pyridoxal 5'-phosphate synthase, partial [Pseudomonadota bacterium]